MSQDQLKTALNYIKEVLGVEGFALPADSVTDASQVVQASAAKPYLFIGSYSENENALLEMQTRMVGALKLSTTDFEFVNLEQTNVESSSFSSAKVIVVFGSASLERIPLPLKLKIGESKALDSTKVLLTHALYDLVSSAPLKKETWTHLQSVF